MKPLLTSLKLLGAVLLLTASVVGFRFFTIWREDSRPTVSAVSWESERITLGQAVLLHVTVRVPWHREIASPVPRHTPGSLVAVQNSGRLHVGPLDWSGHRTCELSIPLRPSTMDPVGSQAIEVPLRPTRRISANSIAFPLPELSVHLPEEIPDSVIVSTEPLKPDAPVAAATTPTPPETPFPFLPVGGALALLAALMFLIRRLSRPKPVAPPWETARKALTQLERQAPSGSALYFLRLTDILKHYTALRFNTPADASSSTELLASITRLPGLDKSQCAPLKQVVRMADSAKFADATIPEDSRRDALVEVRNFVETTTPAPEEDHA